MWRFCGLPADSWPHGKCIRPSAWGRGSGTRHGVSHPPSPHEFRPPTVESDFQHTRTPAMLLRFTRGITPRPLVPATAQLLDTVARVMDLVRDPAGVRDLQQPEPGPNRHTHPQPAPLLIHPHPPLRNTHSHHDQTSTLRQDKRMRPTPRVPRPRTRGAAHVYAKNPGNTRHKPASRSPQTGLRTPLHRPRSDAP